jgi:hypothetical protein
MKGMGLGFRGEGYRGSRGEPEGRGGVEALEVVKPRFHHLE